MGRREKVRRVVDSAKLNPRTQLNFGRGGVLQFRGSERYGPTGLYSDVARILRNYWGPKRGLREIEVCMTARAGRRGQGAWAHPDLVMLAFPRRRRSVTDEKDIHSWEVETHAGFDLRSVYQSHAAGRGSTFSWVVFPSISKTGAEWERIDWAARSLGIGLIEYSRPGSYTTWKVLLEPERRDGDPEDRSNFETLVMSRLLPA